MYRFAGSMTLTTFLVLIFANFIFGQADSIYRLPAGTHIRLKMDAEINSHVASVNDTFVATVVKPVTNRDTIVLPAGTFVEGRISDVTRAAAGGQAGKLDMVFETIRMFDQTRRIDGVMVTPIRAESSRTFGFLSILGGLGAGAAIGAGSNSNNGALIGAGIGGGVGTAVALLRKGKDVRIRKGEEFEIELRKEVMLPVLDY